MNPNYNNQYTLPVRSNHLTVSKSNGTKEHGSTTSWFGPVLGVVLLVNFIFGVGMGWRLRAQHLTTFDGYSVDGGESERSAHTLRISSPYQTIDEAKGAHGTHTYQPYEYATPEVADMSAWTTAPAALQTFATVEMGELGGLVQILQGSKELIPIKDVLDKLVVQAHANEVGFEAAVKKVKQELLPHLKLKDAPLARRYIYASFAFAAAGLQRKPDVSDPSKQAGKHSAPGVHRSDSPRVAAALDALAAGLVRLHYSRIDQVQQDYSAQGLRGKTAPVHFLHISKSGGSTVCAAFRTVCGPHFTPAEEESMMTNCWIRGTGPQWEAPRKHQNLTCKETEDIYSTNNITMLSNEGFLAGTSSDEPLNKLCNDRLLHFTLLRNPFSRTMSHSKLNNVHVTSDEKLEHGQRYAQLDFAGKMSAAPEIFHNYMTRVLAGNAVYNLPPEMLTKQHLFAAQRQIARFDTVGVLEDAAGLQDLLDAMLLFPKEVNFKDIQQRHRGKKKIAKMVNTTSNAEWAMVLEANRLDFQAWQFGWLVFKLDHLIFERGSALAGPRDPSLRVC
jgi:hypothetical protein